ncbi:kinase-like domain-containing protein [Pilobolus umbonatus]|nr:kinase-like domain-containing protein [Pilobolus umbonatus]
MPKVNLNLISGEDNKNKDPKDTPREREQRTIREMAIMHLLRHPHICQLKEWLVYGESYYMFLEYIEGGQLLDYIISHGKLREKLARKFARQIVSALDYCHRNSIVHRDLKIENILITNNEEIKIIDFGLSNVYSPSRLLNTFCGSLYFAAPELLQAKFYTGPEVDVWSFGIVLYVLLCGRVPFDDTSLPALHQKIKAGVVEYPDHLSKVDPAKRETLSYVIHHPWMNKYYDEPIFNHLPHRSPLKSIDRDVIKGMQGFGLGTPEEIEMKLIKIISSPEYQLAAQTVELNYHSQQKNSSNENISIANRLKRSLSLRRNNASNAPKQDDPQSLPIMYDPIISIYTLVKERREYDRKAKLLENNGYQSPVQLGRSASTSLPKPIKVEKGLARRKTERVPPSHTRNLFSDTYNTYSPDGVAVDWASPRSSTDKQHSRSNSFKSTTPTLLQRSRSAAKRLGAMLPTTGRMNNSNIESSYSSSLKKTISLLRSNSLSDRKYRKATRKPSLSSNTEDTMGDIQEHVRYGSSAPVSRSGGHYLETGASKWHIDGSSYHSLINKYKRYTEFHSQQQTQHECTPKESVQLQPKTSLQSHKSRIDEGYSEGAVKVQYLLYLIST